MTDKKKSLSMPGFVKTGWDSIRLFGKSITDQIKSSDLGKDAYVHPLHFVAFWLTTILFVIWLYSVLR